MTSKEVWIQTYGGRAVWPFDPKGYQLLIMDIAHALSNTCRYAGHTNQFYSVAQHCVLVSLTVDDPRHALWGLMHDASEAYLHDITAPVKPHLGGYEKAEKLIMTKLAGRFGLPMPEPLCVKRADRVLAATEKRDLMGPEPMPWGEWIRDHPPLPKRIRPWSPRIARAVFMARYRELTLYSPRSYGALRKTLMVVGDTWNILTAPLRWLGDKLC